jgi:hypothetical protein
MAYGGGCQCGQVRYRAEELRDRSSGCRACQKACGGPKSPKVNDHRRSNIPIENETTFTAVLSLGQGLCFDKSASRAFLGGPSRIDLYKLNTGTCSLVFEHCGQQVFDPDPAEAIDQMSGNPGAGGHGAGWQYERDIGPKRRPV